jgi:hypothetical protein
MTATYLVSSLLRHFILNKSIIIIYFIIVHHRFIIIIVPSFSIHMIHMIIYLTIACFIFFSFYFIFRRFFFRIFSTKFYSIMWTKDQLRDLIDKRKAGNKDYHDLNNNRRYNFWRNVASEINIKFGTTYSGKQCKEKFSALVRDFKVYKKIFHIIIILLY